MGKHPFMTILFMIFVIGFLLFQFAPETFQELKNSLFGGLKNFNKAKEKISSALEVIGNNTYLTMGKIIEERSCTNDLECNDHIAGCENKCTCIDGICKKLIG